MATILGRGQGWAARPTPRTGGTSLRGPGPAAPCACGPVESTCRWR